MLHGLNSEGSPPAVNAFPSAPWTERSSRTAAKIIATIIRSTENRTWGNRIVQPFVAYSN